MVLVVAVVCVTVNVGVLLSFQSILVPMTPAMATMPPKASPRASANPRVIKRTPRTRRFEDVGSTCTSGGTVCGLLGESSLPGVAI